MINRNNYDERQQIERGKAFKNAYITAIMSFLACTFIADIFEMVKISLTSTLIISTWMSLVAFHVTSINKNASDGVGENSRWIGVAIAWLLTGFIFFIFSIITVYNIINGTHKFDENILSTLVMSISMLFLGIYYFYK